MTRPESKFVARMTALFGEPNADLVAVAAEYEAALRGQSAATLERAADLIARERRIRAWPTVAECLDAVAVAKRTVNVAAMALEPIEDFEGWWAERLARIGIATTEREIAAELAKIEPYCLAKQILTSRLGEAQTAAQKRRAEWRTATAGRTVRRTLGEGDAA